MASSFACRLELATPIIPGCRLMLDALLAALIFERCRDPERALAEIPLEREGRIWCGSAALLEGPCAPVPVVCTSAFRLERDLAPADICPTGRGGSYPLVEIGRGHYRNRLSRMLSYEAHAVWFSGRGALTKVRELLRDVPGIGTKRSSGFGAVRSDRIDIEEIDLPKAGVAFADGSPARAVPRDTWLSCGGGEKVEMASESAEPPYWRSTHVVCAVPSHFVVDHANAMRLSGVA
jgi:hypothetical protein